MESGSPLEISGETNKVKSKVKGYQERHRNQ